MTTTLSNGGLGVCGQCRFQRRLDVRRRRLEMGHGVGGLRRHGTAGLPANSSSCSSPPPAAFAACMTSATALSAACPRHALRAIDQHQHPRPAACVEPRGIRAGTDESATSAANCSASANQGPGTAACSPGLAPLRTRSIGTTAGRARRFPTAAPAGRATSNGRAQSLQDARVARHARARVRVRRARRARPSPRPGRGPRSRSRRASGCRAVARTSGSPAAGSPDRAAIPGEPKSSEVSSSFDAPARLTITGSSPTASSTASAGRACEPRRHLQLLGVEPDAARLGHGGRPLHRSAPVASACGLPARGSSPRRWPRRAFRSPARPPRRWRPLAPGQGQGVRAPRPRAPRGTSNRSPRAACAAARGRGRSRRLRQAHRRAAAWRERWPMPGSTRSRMPMLPARGGASIGPVRPRPWR